MATSTLQVVVTGGAGQIAYSLIPLIARGLVFGPATRVHLRLLDIPHAAQALEGVAMEVQDSLFSTALDGVVATTDEGKAFDGAQVAILLGGFPRRPGMERGDLIGKNAGIMKRMGEALELYACLNCKVIVVANPAPTNCVVLASHAPSLPRKNISCLSRLDHDRMVGMLLHEANSRLATGGGQRLGPADVRGVCVWGNHSNSQVPDASGAEFFTNGRWTPAVAIVGNSGWLDLPSSNPQKLGNASPTSSSSSSSLEGVTLAEAVRKRGAAVLTARKLSSAMSAANAIAGHLRDWLAPAGSAPNAQVVSMGVTTDGNPFGVPEGLFCSFPVFCIGGGDWKFADGFGLTDEAGRQLDASVQELKEEKAMTTDMMGGGGDAAGAPTTSPPTPGFVPGQPNGTPISSL